MVARVTNFCVGAGVFCFVFSCSPAAPPPVEPTLDIPRIASTDAGTTAPHFVREAPRVGARSRITVSASTQSPDPQGAQHSSYESELHAEVLSVEGFATTEVRVRFARNAYRFRLLETPTAIDGKTYLVGVNPPFVRNESGGVVPSEEAERVLDVFPDLGTRTRIDEALPDDALHAGDRRDDLARAVLRVLHPRAWTADVATATLSRIEASDAVFAVELAAHSANGTKLDVNGDVRVRLRGAQLASIVLEGSYWVGEKPDGTFRYERTVTDE